MHGSCWATWSRRRPRGHLLKGVVAVGRVADTVADHLREPVSLVVGVAEALTGAALGQGIPAPS